MILQYQTYGNIVIIYCKLSTQALKAVLCLKDVSAGVLRKVSDDTNVFMPKQSVRCRLAHAVFSMASPYSQVVQR